MRILLLIGACSLAYGQAEFLPAPRILHREGVVVDATTGEPISGVEIKASVASPGGTPSVSKAMTDSSGRFRIDAPASRYTNEEFLVFSKDGYLPRESYFGEQLQDASGDLHRTRMVLRLLALATIRGVVLDAHSRPFSQLTVRVMAVGHQDGDGVTVGSNGEFQVRVLPGSYLVCGEPQFSPANQSRMTVGACYPSAPDYASATAVTVRSGETTPPLTIHLGEAPVFVLRGRAAPRHKGWGVQIRADGEDSTAGPRWEGTYFGCLRRDGTFVISGLLAGRYMLNVTTGVSVATLRCDAHGLPDFSPIPFDDCCDLPSPLQPVVYTGERRVTVTGNLSGIVVNVQRERQ